MSSSPRLLGGRYEVGDLIGRGGMAEVHVGYDTRLGRQVAIKMLRWDLARDTSFLARFRREAQSAAGLNNPAIVAVYDSGEEQTRESGGAPVSIPYIVMEYVEGQTLRDLLKERGHLDPDEAARITASVLSALAYSHDKGIVHRDIKPANVMVTPTGAVKVMDFGIARALADTAATMTQSEAVIGTARYLSPEQAQGTTVDARSDLYSTGCMFYELLTGRTPFVGEPVSLVYQHIGEQPLPPSAYQPDVPAALDAVALHALVKDRAHRYQRASEFRADLQAARSGRVISAAARHTAASMAGVGAAGAAGAGAAAGLAGRYGDASETQRLGSDTRTERFDRNEAGAAGAGAAAGAAAGGRPAVPGDDDPHHTAPIPMNVPEKRRRWPWVFLVLLLVAALGVLGYGADRWIVGNQVGSGPYPKVIGMTQREAVDSIHSRGWPVPKIQHQANAAEKGQVFDQDPQPGTELGKDERGTIFVSNGPQTATVPPLVGSDLSSARTTLKNAGLKVGQISHQDSASASKDTVLQTDPGSGEELHVGSPVNLVVATGKNRVPDVVGDDMSTAIQKITDAGFHYDPHFVESTRTPNTVIDEQHAGARVGIGSTIQLTIAKSPPETKTITETQSPTSSPSPTSSEPSPSSTEPSPSSSEPSPTSTTTGPPGSSHTPPGKGGPHGGPPPMQ